MESSSTTSSGVHRQRLDGRDPRYSKSTIRILTIPPLSTNRAAERDDALLQLEMRTIDLDSLAPSDEYEALSYRWNDPISTKRTQVNRYNFPIEENLRAALEALQLPARPRIIWADDICIN
ncbi:hypothetical protein ACJ41O_014403 [Fusarium nematophilum]